MMIFFKLFLLIMPLVLLPYLIGVLVNNKILNIRQSFFAFDMASGYIVMFALFYLITMPLLFAKASLTFLVAVSMISFVLISVFALIFYRQKIILSLKSLSEYVIKLPLLTVIAVVLILLQTFMLAYFTRIDDDDAFFVAQAVTAVETNTIYEYDPYTGLETDGYHMRYVMSPFPIFNAVISEFAGIHPAIMAHTVMPIFLIPLGYIVYMMFAALFFPGKIKSQITFLIFMSVVNIFGYVSVYTQSTFFLYRIWQGKAVLAAILIPAILFFAHKYMRGDIKNGWFIILASVLASCLVSSMGVFLTPVMLGVIALIYTFIERKADKLVATVLCCVPAILCGLIYILF